MNGRSFHHVIVNDFGVCKWIWVLWQPPDDTVLIPVKNFVQVHTSRSFWKTKHVYVC